MKIRFGIISALLSISSMIFGQAETFPLGSEPPGYVDAENTSSCFDFMGPVTFSPSYRFITSYTGSAPSGWTGGVLNPPTNYLSGFTIPLVADLDGDGYPEVIAQMQYGTGAYGLFTGIEIFNGQTGKSMAKLYYGTNSLYYFYNYGWHASPSQISLVDADRNNKVEVIVAFPQLTSNSSLNTLRSRVASYEFTPVKDVNGITTTYTWTQKWLTAATYNDAQTNYAKAIPQIVDLDGDGVPEVVVYNKVYNAVTGALLLTIGTLGTDANVGVDLQTYGGELHDKYVNLSYIYDIDLDGTYDLIAGGKIYKINKTGSTWSYTTITMPGIPDGRTGVADIDGDGIADVVTVWRAGTASTSNINITVWNPNTHIVDGSGNVVANTGTQTPYIVADAVVPIGLTTYGGYSYVYIGDIDGKEQTYNGKTYRLPEVAILTGRVYYNQITAHPNVTGLPTTGYAPSYGVLIAYTIDKNQVSSTGKLKTSFILEHNDDSNDTGFTMFDFDNDGVNEICYRDNTHLRIIKPTVSYIANGVTTYDIFRQPVASGTGFEYPVIADIDNDASAEIIVLGGAYYPGYIYAVGTSGDKVAPALPVWNQFMYDPFKIDENLQTPTGGRHAINRLDPKYRYTQVIRDANLNISKIITDINPYNKTLGQIARYQLTAGEYPTGTSYNNLFEPLVYLTESYVVANDATNTAQRPTIGGTNPNGYIQLYVGNKAQAKADVSLNTPISVYINSVSATNFVKKVTLAELGVTSVLKAGEAPTQIRIPIADIYGYYIIRFGDNSNLSNTSNPIWSWGYNSPGYNNTVTCMGTATRAFRDCDWSDQKVYAAKFAAVDDMCTLQEYGAMTIDVFANDILPADFTFTGFTTSNTTAPSAGEITFNNAGVNSTITYRHLNKTMLPNGFDSFTYTITYTDPSVGLVTRTATVYVYILQSSGNGFSNCYGESTNIELKNTPTGIKYYWYQPDGVTEITPPDNPKLSVTIPSLTTDVYYKIKPVIPEGNIYDDLTFPQGDLKVSVITSSVDEVKTMIWTGTYTTDWFNPSNWTDENGVVLTYAPSSCVDVVLPENKINYPTVNKAGRVNNIDIGNRAMIANTHNLSYNEASMEVKFGATERNRWVMYSAPFGKTYSGDYMLLGNDNYPIKKAVYMSLFQQNNPDGSDVAAVNQFSKSFSSVTEELGLGKGFILRVDGAVDASSSFKFPAKNNQYEYYYKNQWGESAPDPSLSTVLDRKNGGSKAVNGRFITEMTTTAANGSFTMTMPNDVATSDIIMVTNPYNAYLDMNVFFAANPGLQASKYFVWSGSAVAGFITFQKSVTNKWIMSDPATYISANATSGQYVSPYQSFFVLKTSPGSTVPVSFAPETMTYTVGTNYLLKNAAEIETGVMYVTVSSQGVSSTAALTESAASSTTKLFYNDTDATAVDVYTLSPQGKALSIKALQDDSEVKLGLRMKDGGDIEFDFSGVAKTMAGVGIYLKDGEKLIKVTDNTVYKATVAKPTHVGNAYFEVNNRFALVFKKK